MNTLAKMRADAQLIFSAGLRAVDPEIAVNKYCRIDGNRLRVGSVGLDLDSFEKRLHISPEFPVIYKGNINIFA